MKELIGVFVMIAVIVAVVVWISVVAVRSCTELAESVDNYGLKKW